MFINKQFFTNKNIKFLATNLLIFGATATRVRDSAINSDRLIFKSLHARKVLLRLVGFLVYHRREEGCREIHNYLILIFMSPSTCFSNSWVEKMRLGIRLGKSKKEE